MNRLFPPLISMCLVSIAACAEKRLADEDFRAGSGGQDSSPEAPAGGSGNVAGQGGTGPQDASAGAPTVGGAVNPTDGDCTNGVADGRETDVDCGGPNCVPCQPGRRCAARIDCITNSCTSGLCDAPSCVDGVRNQTETDVDCGGSVCAPCAEGAQCAEASDCAAEHCLEGRCLAGSCSDGRKNQDETDVDCGGRCVGQPCGLGQACASAADCASYICASEGCAADMQLATEDMIDDMEDSNHAILSRESRAGSWFKYNDQSAGGLQVFSMDPIPGARGGSLSAAHATGSGFTNWGSGFAFDLNNPGKSATTKQPYDASYAAGITFWARAESSVLALVGFPDINTDPSGEVCTVCNFHFAKNLQLSTDWQRYVIYFEELKLQSGAVPAPAAPARHALLAVNFHFMSGTDYDVWIDDVAFVR